jgi:recombination protein RecT
MAEQGTVATIERKPPIVILRERLDARVDELKAALPSDIDPQKFKRAVLTAASINPDLQACAWQSLWNACLRACQDGLLPDGRQGAIVPYKDRATWIPMYQGLLLRAWRTGRFKWIGANIVREGEPWEHHVDATGEHFHHVPGDDTDAPMLRVYAAATTLDGGTFIAVLPKAEVDKIQRMSKASRDDSPWKMWPSEMQKKTALRRLAKLLPVELGAEDEVDDEHSADAERAPIAVTGNRPAGAAAALAAFAADDEQTIEDEKAQASGSLPASGVTEAAPTSPPATEAGDVGNASSSTDASPAAAFQAAPKNFEQYVQLVETTCIAATDAVELKKWFASDAQRRLRNACNMIAEDTAQMRGLVETRIKQLGGK